MKALQWGGCDFALGGHLIHDFLYTYQELKSKESKNKREEKKGLKNKKQQKKELNDTAS